MMHETETAEILSSTHDGKGIASTEGKKVFVRGAIIGETVKFIRRKKRRNYDEAELIEVIRRSKDRVDPRCQFYNQCGGCSLQHLSPNSQRDLKEGVLRDNLARIGSVTPSIWLKPIFNNDDGEWNYRRRARIAVKDVEKKGRVLVGFREKFAPFVVDMNNCEILSPPVNNLIKPLSNLIESLSIRREIPQIEVAVGENDTELVFRVLIPPSDDDKVKLVSFAKENQLRLSIQTGGMDSVKLLFAKSPDEALRYSHKKFDIINEFDSTDFIQVNGVINSLMVAQVIELLELRENHKVIDLFCGIGNFTLPVAKYVSEVIGIELLDALIKRGEHNANLNNINNVKFLCKDLNKIDNTYKNFQCDRLILDPSRNGALDVVNNIKYFNPKKIIYVSCHPGTLARDANILVNQYKYDLSAAGIIDMFPHTSHVESIAVFNK